jgi:hypothetical protein
MSRPTIYTEDLLVKIREYRDLEMPHGDEVIHSIEGLAIYAGIARSTIYKWKDELGKGDFSDIVEEILEKQGSSLFNNGLNGKFSPTITKVILTKHGYREGIETTGKDGKDISVELIEKRANDIVDE